jgi:PAS domain S-box-containing protein
VGKHTERRKARTSDLRRKAEGRFKSKATDVSMMKEANLRDLVHELESQQVELEKRVEERTADLFRTNERLKEEIRERERSEQALRLEEARLEALLRLSQIGESTVHEMAEFTLEREIALTQSKIGFLGFLSEDEAVYTLHAVSRNMVKECDVTGNPIQWHIAGAGLWADAIRQRKTLFVNDYRKSIPGKKGLPSGHPPVERFMVVPVSESGRIVAVAGVGNKASDYDKSDERQVVLLLSGMWSYLQRERSREALQEAYNELEQKVEQRTAELSESNTELQREITERRRSERAVERQNQLLAGINRIFEAVVTGASDEEFGTACLAVAEEITGSAISFVAETGPDGLLHDLAISNPGWEACSMYDREGHRKPPGDLRILGIYGRAILDGRTVLVNDTASHPARVGLPPGHAPLTSFLGVPLKKEDRTVGVVAVGNRQGGYGPGEQEALETLALAIAAALARKRAEEALRASENKYRELVQNANSAVIRWQRDGKITFFNEYAQSLFGYRTEEIIGRHVGLLLPQFESSGADLRGLIEDIVAHPQNHVQNVNENVCRDGRRVWMAWTNRPVYDQTGQVAEILAVGVDMTELKRAEEALKASDEQLKRAQEIAHVGSWELDLVNDRLYWSDEAYRIFGLKPQQFGATYEAFLEAVHPDDRAAVDAAYSDSIRDGKTSYEVEHRVVRRGTGEIRVVQEKCRHVTDEAGRITRSVGMVMDVTERKQAEEGLRRTLEELARSNRELEQFAYVASHDLKEPLRMVTGFTGLLKNHCQGKLDTKADQYIAFAAEAAERMVGLIDDLLAYARVGRDPNTEATDVAAAVDRALRNLRASIEESGAHITLEPFPTVRANPLELTQLFQNLVGNSLKFRDETRPEIHIGAGRKQAQWVFTVRDNGIGIDPQFADRVFTIFQRLHTRDRYPGTGVGLAICKKIVERHGGRIWVESEPGKGATFCFTLPA